MSLPELGVFALAASLTLLAIGRAPKTRILLMGFASLSLIGGLLARGLNRLCAWLLHFTDLATAKFFAVGVPAVIVLVALIWMYPQLHRKNSNPHKHAIWVALLLPPLMLAAGGAWAHLEVSAKGGANSGGNAIVQAIDSLASSW